MISMESMSEKDRSQTGVAGRCQNAANARKRH